MKQLAIIGSNRFAALRPTRVYDTFWRFAAARQEIFFRRLEGFAYPWTRDQILQRHKFTNAYRASDRVSQILIRDVIYNPAYSSDPREIVFRTLLFKLFNKIETWRYLESVFGLLCWKNFDVDRYDEALTDARSRGQRIYSAAYIIPPVYRGEGVKHRGHLKLIAQAMHGGLPRRLEKTSSLADVFWLLKEYPSLGDFTAFQITIDLNYSTVLNYEESEFVVAGPGALDGLAKCFENASDYPPEDLIEFIADRQEKEFDRLGIKFRSLWGRPLQLIDCQNLLCEISKYSRVAHPEFSGVSGRTRIKQMFRASSQPLSLWYPPKWGLNEKLPQESQFKGLL
jgi:alpha-glutamyl/putrescinyl thymine pyrophosphorylase clade 1